MEKETALFFKQYHSILKLKLTDKRKMILCALMSTYERFFTEELEYKGFKYHFYFNQKDLYNALGMAQRTFEYNLKWLKDNGYIGFEATNKQGYLCPTTYFYINSDIINLVVPQKSKKSNSDDNAEQESLTPPEEIEQESNNSINKEIATSETNSISMEEVEQESNHSINNEVPTSIETNSISTETIEEVSTSTENSAIPTETIEVITEPTEENAKIVAKLLLGRIREVLEHASFVYKSGIEAWKAILIDNFGIDTVKKGMYKCLDDGWFSLIDSDFNGKACYNIKNYEMLKNITLEELDELEYNELHDKAKNKK